MSLRRIKSMPTNTIKVVDVLPYTVIPSSSASVQVISGNLATIIIEDLRGHLVELSVTLDSLVQLNNALQTIVSISQSPIQVRSRNIMLGKNTVTFNREVSPYIDASNFVGDYDAILDNAFNTNIYWDLGSCYLIPNGDFFVLLSIDRTGVLEDDITLVYRSTLIATLITLQSVHVFDSLELNMMCFNLDSSLLVQDETVVHYRNSVLLNHEGSLYVARSEIVELLLENRENKISTIKINDAFHQIGLTPSNNNSYRSVKLVKSGSESLGTLETYIEFTSIYGLNKPDLRMYVDGTVHLGTVYGSITKRNVSYLDRPHSMTDCGTGTPASLLKDNFVGQDSNIDRGNNSRTALKQSRVFAY